MQRERGLLLKVGSSANIDISFLNPSLEQENTEPSEREIRRRERAKIDYKEKSDQEYFKEIQNYEPSPIKKNSFDGDSAASKRFLNAQKLQSMIVQLRKVCNHPYLFNISEEDPDGLMHPVVKPGKIPEITRWSGKMMLLERLIPKLFQEGHKVLIFSQMTRMLDVIADWCDFVKGWQFARIDGQVKIDERRNQVRDVLIMTRL
jgi:ATP-dependent DNA helicase